MMKKYRVYVTETITKRYKPLDVSALNADYANQHAESLAAGGFLVADEPDNEWESSAVEVEDDA